MNAITEKELVVLHAITVSDFYENGRESIVWDFSVLDDLPLKGKTRSGVIGSLANKGFIWVTEKEKRYKINEYGQKVRNPYYSPNDYGTFQITEAGYAVLDSMGLIDEDGRFI